ncbi:MAG TPA: anti-sigma factor [Candidatus Binatia bacterium]|nr:anti-sigma factor [Candidatus Binatia bacterium]
MEKDLEDGPSALRRAWVRWSVGAAAAMLVGAFLGAGFVAARYEARLGRMARELADLRERLRQQESAEELLGVLAEPDTRLVVLEGAGPARSARGRLIWSDLAGGRLVITGLPALPSDRIYHAWTIGDGKASAAGTFRPDRSGRAVHALPPASGPVRAVSITLEPVTGTRVPTGPVVLSASLAPAGKGRRDPARSGGILEAR